MAIDILSIPAMSDEPERVFSGTRRTISWERMRLGPSTVERTQCLKSWLQANVISQAEEEAEGVPEAKEGSEQGSASDRD